MNNEVIKAMNRKPTKAHNVKKWWSKNGYKVMRVIFFPVWAVVWSKEKITHWLNAHTEWSENRVVEILNYYIPRYAEWDKEKKSFYFFDNGYGWSMHFAKKYLKLKDRRFWKKYANWSGSRIRDYLLYVFELEGFTKELGDCHDGWTEVTFTMNETED